MSGNNCVCVITRRQTEKLKGQNQIGVKSNVSTSIATSYDVPVGNAPMYEKDKHVPSTSSGQTFENDPTSIVTSDNCYKISQGLSKRSKCKIKSNCRDSSSDKQLNEAQMNDSTLKQVIKFKQENENPPKRSILGSECPEVKTLCAQWTMLEIYDKMLYRKWVPDGTPENPILQFVVPNKMKNEILIQLHNHKTSGHLGVQKTFGKLKQRFYWPRYKEDIASCSKTCRTCNRHKSDHMPKKASLKQDFVSAPMKKIVCDIMDPLPETEKKQLCQLCQTITQDM